MQLPIAAFLYDFDKTLCTTDMQDYAFIPSLGMTPAEFWSVANDFGRRHRIDSVLAYMYTMIQEAERRELPFTRGDLVEKGRDIVLFPGVEDWFRRVNAFGEEQGVRVEHYIISSGLREMIEGTSIAKAGVFERIYASSFYYNSRGVAVWPAMNVNYTNKTQFLFRIRKGVPDVTDPAVNDYFPPERLRVPFCNMVYIGDSDTDIPCMQLVTSGGGCSVGVYDPAKGDAKVLRMLREGRISFCAPADYNPGSALDCLIRGVILKAAARQRLETLHRKQLAYADSVAADGMPDKSEQ